MRPFRIPRSGRSPRVRGLTHLVVVLAGLVGLQLAVAVPAQARAGDLDPTFGTGGKVTTDFAGGDDIGISLVVQPSGKLVAGGFMGTEAGYDFALARYRA